MQVIINQIPNILNYSQYISLTQISSDVSLIIVYKTMYRSDDVLLDIYINEMSNNTKIVSGRKLTTDSIISLPRYDIGFSYWINCVDQYDINTSINKHNAHKFYLQFTSYEGEDW